MTAPNGPILFNSSTGSDTAASGLGPDPAQSGTGASTTAGSAVVTGITTTGVQPGDLLWVQSSSGRQFSIIASVDGTQVTCDDTFANTESGRNWAIGGKRATISSSTRLFESDLPPKSIIELEDNDSISARLNTGETLIRGSLGSRKTLTMLTDSTMFLPSVTIFENLKLENSASNKSNSYVHTKGSGGYGDVSFRSCVIGDSANQFSGCYESGSGGGLKAAYSNCLIHHGISEGFSAQSDAGEISFLNCTIRNNGGVGISGGSSLSAENLTVVNCLIFNNAGDGVYCRSFGRTISNNCIYGNSGDGIRCNRDVRQAAYIKNNIITQNGGFGLNLTFIQPAEFFENVVYANAFHGNTSGPRNNVNEVPNDIMLTADPFVDAANGDFNLNNDPGGGKLLRAATATLP